MSRPIEVHNPGEKAVRLFVCARSLGRAASAVPFDIPAKSVARLDVQHVELWVDGGGIDELPTPEIKEIE